MNALPKDIYKLVNQSRSFLIITHKRPDADAIASAIALSYYLISIGKKKENIQIVIPSISKDLEFIAKNFELLKSPDVQAYDLIILLDCSDIAVVEGADFLGSSTTLVIDHHSNSSVKADMYYIDTFASSCTLIIYRLFSRYIQSSEFLQAIALGILSDTMSLSIGTSPECLRVLNEISSKLSLAEVSKSLKSLDTRTLELISITSKRLREYYGISCTYLVQSDLVECEKDLSLLNHKAILEHLLSNYNQKTLLLLIQMANGDFKGSIRTKEAISLSDICNKLKEQGLIHEGGGHNNSAGFKISLDLSYGIEGASKYVCSMFI